MDLNTVLKETREKYAGDVHIVRFYTSFVTVSNGKVVDVTAPCMTFCPLANVLYRNKGLSGSEQEITEAIKRGVTEKIRRFGHFTGRRKLFDSAIAVPYGASEMMMYALRKDAIDAAVVVCEGAGTVVAGDPAAVQGIGARMNGLFYTSPIREIVEKLTESGTDVLFADAAIDQAAGVRRAAEAGYRKIAVTVNCFSQESLKAVRDVEKSCGVSVVILAICTTGITEKRIREIECYADLVWSCGSGALREIIGKTAILQLSRKIPVFVLTPKGLDFISSYCRDPELIKGLSADRQYFIAGNQGAVKTGMGNFDVFLTESALPVRDSREPVVIE